jgi:FkbM family methyltransferase
MLPFKLQLFYFMRAVYTPSIEQAGYLKFSGAFKLQLGNRNLKLFNSNRTIPSILFWRGIGGYERQSITIWSRLSQQARVIFDVGANFGLFGLIGQLTNRVAQVYYFEPLARNAQLIQRNLTLNRFDSIVERYAVSNLDGEATFYDMEMEDNTIGSLHESFVRSHRHSKRLIPIKVPTTRLDTYIEGHGIDKIDLVKIDVEGSDYEVMEGFQSSLSKFQPTILIEITNEITGAKINELLRKLGVNYLYFEIDEKYGLLSRNEISRVNVNRNYLICKEEIAHLLSSDIRS